MSRLPKYILFDLDGTLLDSLPGIDFSVHSAFAACGLQLLHNDIRGMIGPPIRTILSTAGGIFDENSLDKLEQAFRADYDSAGWHKTVCFPDAGRVLRAMHERGHQLFVLSNKPRHTSLQILEREAILKHFRAIVTRDSRSPIYSGKKEMIVTLVTDHKITMKDCLMVGDTIEDAKAAASVGIRFAWATYGYGTVAETPSIPVAYTLDSLSEFLALMEPVRD